MYPPGYVGTFYVGPGSGPFRAKGLVTKSFTDIKERTRRNHEYMDVSSVSSKFMPFSSPWLDKRLRKYGIVTMCEVESKVQFSSGKLEVCSVNIQFRLHIS